MQNKVRIIAGQWRGRNISFDDAEGLRPTPSRVRETLFNWLQADIFASRCLDLYAGSGTLGFEAASRGAKTVVQVEQNPSVCKQLSENAAKLQAGQVKLVSADVVNFLNGAAQPFDLVFIDPPFAKNLILPTVHLLEQRGWLAPEAKIYLETETELELTDLPNNWTLLKSKTAGAVAYRLFARA